MNVSFPPKLYGVTKKVTFNFISELAPGETISTATVAATVWSGNDPTPSGIVSGAASISGTTVTQTITGGVIGTIYKLLCTITTSAGQTLQGWGLLAVLADEV